MTHVINYTVPEDEKAYLHRVGRTGRAGRTGIAVTFVDWEDLTRWKHINDALEFGQPDPAETYSSSKHLFADLDIPEGTKGRIRRERTASEKAESAKKTGEGDNRRGRSGQGRSGQGRSGQGRSGQAGSAKSDAPKTETHGGHEHPRPARNRQRRRTRGAAGGNAPQV